MKLETREKQDRQRDGSYFLKQMVNLLHAPFHVFDGRWKALEQYGTREEERLLSKRNVELWNRFKEKAKMDYPALVEDGKLVFGVIADKEKETILIVGPVVMGALNREELTALWGQYKIDSARQYHPSVCSITEFVSGMLMIYAYLTGEQLTTAEFWEYNKGKYAMDDSMERSMSQDLFVLNENVEVHNPYEQELRELESIRKGDVEALARSISEVYQGKIGVLAKDPLRSQKNVAVGNITMASRAAIQGGVSVEKSFSMADSLIRQLEEINNVPEVESFKREAQYSYARIVHQENSWVEDKPENGAVNPLVQRVKDYVFSHLHESIQVADIARQLQVNPDYLSHMFRMKENITLSGYVQQEKIRRGENLLKYSDYRVQEIAFYLGFCSQSHFAKIFEKIDGMSPSEYRRKFGNNDKWKIRYEI